MQSRARWPVLLLAALLNLLGSPMAWANLLGATDVPGAAATQEPASQSCHGHAQGPDEPATAPDSMPCCDGGGCYCAAPALTLPMVPETRRLPHLNVFGPFDTSALPANPLDDSLRPPIR